MSKSISHDPFVSSSLLLEFVSGVDRRERTNATATKVTNALTVGPILMNPSPMPKPMAAKKKSPKKQKQSARSWLQARRPRSPPETGSGSDRLPDDAISRPINVLNDAIIFFFSGIGLMRGFFRQTPGIPPPTLCRSARRTVPSSQQAGPGLSELSSHRRQ